MFGDDLLFRGIDANCSRGSSSMATGDFGGEFEEVTLPGVDEGEILVIRSTRRKKSISAYRQGAAIRGAH